MNKTDLPPEFADLEPWVEEWALTTEKDRYAKLHAVSLPALEPFYQSMVGRLEAILDYLNQYEVGALPPEAATLFDLTLTFAEVAHPVDLGWTDVDFPSAYAWEVLEFRSVSSSDEVSNARR